VRPPIGRDARTVVLRAHEAAQETEVDRPVGDTVVDGAVAERHKGAAQGLSKDVQETLEKHERDGTTDSEEYLQGGDGGLISQVHLGKSSRSQVGTRGAPREGGRPAVYSIITVHPSSISPEPSRVGRCSCKISQETRVRHKQRR